MAETYKFEFDKKWLLILVVILGALIAAIFLNTNVSKTNISQVTGTISTDEGDLKIDWDRYSTYEVELFETYTITKSGTYHLTGNIEDGAIIVKGSGEDSAVKLILDNVTIKNSAGPAIACYQADDLVIELVGENFLEDGKTYSSDYDEDVKGAIYSKSDLAFQGDGSLTLTAHHQDGIVSKDDLKFNSGTFYITAADDGIRGKDSVYIVDGTFNITANADAIKSTNENTVGKGFILIRKGTFYIAAKAKGLKAVNNILIYDGTFEIDSTDDAVHSNNYVGLMGGNLTINSGDDGIHADKELVVEGGTISIEKSYEGFEAKAITINDGEISIVASDDGMNAGGGADASANNRPGAGAFDVDTDCVLTINGGNIYINAAGDGVDSNGYLYFNGGNVAVDGPTNNGNGALDSGAGIVQNGGTVIAVGASGMAETLGSDSVVYNASIYFTVAQSAGTKITIKDAAGTTIIRHVSKKAFNHMAVGTTKFELGATYTIYIDGEEYQSFTISSVTTTIGRNNTNQNTMPGGDPNDRPGNFR